MPARTKLFPLAVMAIALFGGLTPGSAHASVPSAGAPRPPKTITVRPGDDVNAAVSQARNGDTIYLKPGHYRGGVTVDKSITLSGTQATVDASRGATGISITADGVTLDAVATSCSGGGSYGIRVVADHVRIVNSPVLQCEHGIVLDHAKDAYLQGDALLGGDAAGPGSIGVSATGADGLTMLSNTFDSVGTGVEIAATAAPLVDANTFSGVDTAVSLLSVTNAVIHGTLVVDARGPAVLVSGSTGAEIARLNPSGNGGGAAAAIRLSASAGPSWIVTIEDSNFAHFATGLQIDSGALSAGVTVIGSTFEGVKGAAIVAAPSSGGTVDATVGDYFGGCGPRAPDHDYDGGGANVNDPQRVVSYRENNCGATAAATAPPSGSPAANGAPPADARRDVGEPGVDLSSAIGSVLVTVGVSLLLAACAGGVLYAIRRSRHVH